MSELTGPWARGRGLQRLLAIETNISDLIQMLSDLDPTPWERMIGFVPEEVTREVEGFNKADLLLSANAREAVVEVKLGHLMDARQQQKYESISPGPDLYLAALELDKHRTEGDSRWRFLSLSALVGQWANSPDVLAQALSSEACKTLQAWDRTILAVFDARSPSPLNVINQKFLGRVVTRRIAERLEKNNRLARASVTSGGGLPIIQAWRRSGVKELIAPSSRRSGGGGLSPEAN